VGLYNVADQFLIVHVMPAAVAENAHDIETSELGFELELDFPTDASALSIDISDEQMAVVVCIEDMRTRFEEFLHIIVLDQEMLERDVPDIRKLLKTMVQRGDARKFFDNAMHDFNQRAADWDIEGLSQRMLLDGSEERDTALMIVLAMRDMCKVLVSDLQEVLVHVNKDKVDESDLRELKCEIARKIRLCLDRLQLTKTERQKIVSKATSTPRRYIEI